MNDGFGAGFTWQGFANSAIFDPFAPRCVAVIGGRFDPPITVRFYANAGSKAGAASIALFSLPFVSRSSIFALEK
jgi:hypothetical protein